MVKPLVIALCCVSYSAGPQAARAQRPEVRYEYHDRDFTWNKRELDTPPLPVGGQAAITRYLDYPRELRRQRIEGRSIVSVTVDSAGRIRGIVFAPSMYPQLQQIVRGAVLHCEWKPGMKKGAKKTGTVSFPIRFVISAR